MWSRIRNLFGTRTGFVYTSDDEDGPMRNAAPGVVVRNPDHRPPWIVVDHSLESVTVARWPGRLWKAEILHKAPEQASADAHYTRAVAVQIVSQEPMASLFGSHGSLVERVIETAASLTIRSAERLGHINPAARDAYGRAWRRWLMAVQPDSIHLHSDHTSTLAIPVGMERAHSPIGIGFSVLYDVIFRRARALAGDSAFVVDEEGDAELVPVWTAAAEAFLHAAMGHGAPELTGQDDAERLTAMWDKEFANGNTSGER